MLGSMHTTPSGREADAVVEVVGLSPALRTAFGLVRPFGVVSSIGVYHSQVSDALPKILKIQLCQMVHQMTWCRSKIPWTGNEVYKQVAYIV